MQKKWLLLCLLIAVCAAAGIGVYGYNASSQHTVGDFSYFPYELRHSDRIIFNRDGSDFELVRENGNWHISSPINAPLSEWGQNALNILMTSRVFVDTREPAKFTADGSDYRRAQNDVSVEFFKGNERIVRMTIGAGKREETSDAERRWVFVDGDDSAYRVFVPLTDFGETLSQPLSAWRNTLLAQIDSRNVTKIAYYTMADDIMLDRQGTISDDNPQGWRVARAIGRDIDDASLKTFVIDERRVATILDMTAPLYVDDFADGISWEDAAVQGARAQIRLTHDDTVTTFEIGDEIDDTQYPQFKSLGDGARFARLQNSAQVAVISARRLLGMMPGFNDLRTKKVWKLSSSSFSCIELRMGARTWKYHPGNTKAWIVSENGNTSAVQENKLITFIKTLSNLEVLRYATSDEKNENLNAAEIRVYENNAETPTHKMTFGGSHDGIYRFAQADDGPVFALPEIIARILFDDIRAVNQ